MRSQQTLLTKPSVLLAFHSWICLDQERLLDAVIPRSGILVKHVQASGHPSCKTCPLPSGSFCVETFRSLHLPALSFILLFSLHSYGGLISHHYHKCQKSEPESLKNAWIKWYSTLIPLKQFFVKAAGYMYMHMFYYLLFKLLLARLSISPLIFKGSSIHRHNLWLINYLMKISLN